MLNNIPGYLYAKFCLSSQLRVTVFELPLFDSLECCYCERKCTNIWVSALSPFGHIPNDWIILRWQGCVLLTSKHFFQIREIVLLFLFIDAYCCYKQPVLILSILLLLINFLDSCTISNRILVWFPGIAVCVFPNILGKHFMLDWYWSYHIIGEISCHGGHGRVLFDKLPLICREGLVCLFERQIEEIHWAVIPDSYSSFLRDNLVGNLEKYMKIHHFESRSLFLLSFYFKSQVFKAYIFLRTVSNFKTIVLAKI